MSIKTEPIVRFLAKVQTAESGCWLWVGTKDGSGYGSFKPNGRTVQAHRWSYEYHREAIPQGLCVDHLCRNRACVNPDHMEVVTRKENTLRGETLSARNKMKTHCPQGHPYDSENTFIKKGMRNCRICKRASERKRYYAGK